MIRTYRSRNMGWRSPAIAVASATAENSSRDVGRPDVGTDRAGRLGAGDQLGDRAHQLVAYGQRSELELVRHLLGERTMASVELGKVDEEPFERLRGIRAGERFPRLLEHRLEHGGEHCFDERLLGRKVAAHRADTHTGPAGDLLHLGLQARLGEDLLGRGKDPLAIADGVGAAGAVW